jgi:hypothetical protein
MADNLWLVGKPDVIAEKGSGTSRPDSAVLVQLAVAKGMLEDCRKTSFCLCNPFHLGGEPVVEGRAVTYSMAKTCRTSGSGPTFASSSLITRGIPFTDLSKK